MQVAHSTAPSLIIDWLVCQSYSDPREERAACGGLQQGKQARQARYAWAGCSPLRTGHGL